MTGAVLLLALAAEGVTIVWLGPLLAEHIFIGALLIPIVTLKLATTGYRFARYYTGERRYREKGPPAAWLRLTAPFSVALTVLVLASGVALLLHGPDGGLLLLIHKASFIGWLAFISLHILGHIRSMPADVSADWRREEPAARVAGSSARLAALVSAVAAGVLLAFAALSLDGSWMRFHG
jgi:hypothetical protein